MPNPVRRLAVPRLLLPLLLIPALLLAPALAAAQLFAPNAAGMSMGHILLNVRDVEAHRAFWTKHFDARPVTVGRLSGVSIPGVVILFRLQEPTGPVDGETINHMGIKVTHLDPYLPRFTADGFKLDPVRIGRETTPQTYVTAPEGFRIEMVEDTTLPRPMVNHHLHYWLADTAAVNRWYAQVVGLEPTMRGPYPSADVPGDNLTFAPLGNQREPGVPTKGRMMDSIGFEIVGLNAYCERLKAKGVVFDKEYGMDAELGINTATITDPWGVTIRFTEGLSAVAGVAPYRYVDRYVVPSRM